MAVYVCCLHIVCLHIYLIESSYWRWLCLGFTPFSGQGDVSPICLAGSLKYASE
jgi:hypothetical protein